MIQTIWEAKKRGSPINPWPLYDPHHHIREWGKTTQHNRQVGSTKGKQSCSNGWLHFLLDAMLKSIPTFIPSICLARERKRKWVMMSLINGSFFSFLFLLAHLQSSMDAIPHDGDKLAVRQSSVPIRVEDDKDGPHHMRTERCAGANLHSSVKLLCQKRRRRKTWRNRLMGHSGQNNNLPSDMGLSACKGNRCGTPITSYSYALLLLWEKCVHTRLYILMAIVKSSRLLRKLQKSRNSLKVMPFSTMSLCMSRSRNSS